MNDTQVKAIRDYYKLISEAKGKTFMLKSFGKVIMFGIPLAKAIEFSMYYKNTSIEEYTK